MNWEINTRSENNQSQTRKLMLDVVSFTLEKYMACYI